MTTARHRFPLLALAILSMLAALWAGWVRLGWQWPAIQPTLPLSHGPLMVSGFLGTLIAVERAIALQKRWMYLGPVLSGVGGILLMIGIKGLAGPLLITLGSFVLVLIFGVIVKQHTALYTVVMALGAVAWLAGNSLWLLGWPVYHIVLWWMGFLVLTVAGERLELGRLLRLSRLSQGLFLAAAIAFLAGLLILLPAPNPGTQLAGAAMLALALWLLRYDIARRTVRQTGLPRYAALCLLSGYVWLGIGGLLAIIYGAQTAGPRYDAMLHAVFLGFIFSMIFGHAPIIFPAVLGLPVQFKSIFYLHLLLLHLSLIIRLAGDLLGFGPARLWGGLLNGIALLLFLASTAYSLQRSRQQGTI